MNRREAGFSLLEIIVALAVLALGISSAFALFGAATAAHKRAIDRVHAATIAEQSFADVESALARGMSPEEVIAEPPLSSVHANYPGYDVTLLFYEIDGSTGDDEILLEVRVNWRFRGQDRTEIFQQIIVAAVERR